MRLRRAALLVVSLTLAACGATGPVPIAVPAPSNPGPSGLLIRLDLGDDDFFGLGRHSADYLSDGTVIRWVSGPACELGQGCGALERNALTASGLAAFKALLAKDADLLGKAITIKSQIAPDAQPSGRGETTDVFVQERPDGTRYTVKVPSTSSYDAKSWVPDPAITRLNALADVMADPATLVGANGVAHPVWEAYQPTAVALFVRMTAAPPEITPYVTKDGMEVGPFPTIYVPDLHKTGWPFGATPDTIGVAFTPDLSNDRFAPVDATYRCVFLANADAVTGIASLPDAGRSYAASEMAAGRFWGGAGERWDNLDLLLRAIALMPEDVAGSCADALTY